MKTSDENFNSIYEKVRETQKKIHAEMLFDQMLDQHSYEFAADNFKNNYKLYLINDKQYYSKFLMSYFLSNPNNQNKLIIRKLTTFFENRSIKEGKKIPSCFNFKNLSETLLNLSIQGKLNSILTDIISLTIIPSLFSMFFEEKIFHSFIDFIGNLAYKDEKGEIKHDLQLTFSRSIFVSPLFLNFSHQAFYPIFNRFFSQNQLTSDRQIINFQMQILKSFISNLKYFPSFVNDFLKIMNDQYNLPISVILKTNFFEPMIKNPSLFLGADSFYCKDENKIKMISKYLSKIIIPIINDFSNIIKDNNIAYRSYINTHILKIYRKHHPSFEIIDNIDVKAFNEILNIQKGNDSSASIYEFDEYIIYEGDFETLSDDKDNEQYQRLNVSQVVTNDYWGHLRKLIKESQPLPPSTHEAPNQEQKKDFNNAFFQMIDDTLIDKYNPFTSVQNKLAFLFVKKKLKISQKDISKNLDLMITKHDEIVKAVAEVNELISESSILNKKKKYSYYFLTSLLIFLLTSNIKIDEKLIKSLSEYKLNLIMKNTSQYKALLVEYYSFCLDEASKIIEPPFSPELLTQLNSIYISIFTHRFWKNLDFNLYLAYRPELIKYDQIVFSFLSQNFSKVFNFIKSKINEAEIPYKLLVNLSNYKEFIINFKSIFDENSSPYEKYTNVFAALNLLKNDFKSDSEDTYQSLAVILTCSANPQHLISSFAYMFEFLIYKNNNIFDNSILKLIDYIVLIINGVLNKLMEPFQFPFHTIFRTSALYYQFYVTGDTVKNIVLAYNSIMKGTNDLKRILKNDDEINQFEQKINNNNFVEMHMKFHNTYDFHLMHITIRIFKNFTENIFNMAPDQRCTRWAFYGSSSTFYSTIKKSEEEVFSALKGFQIKFIVPQEDANKQNLKSYHYKERTLERDNNSLSMIISSLINCDEVPDLSKVRITK